MNEPKKKPELTQEQKSRILQLYSEDKNTLVITKDIFGNTDVNGKPIDGRSIEGRVIKEFLGGKGKKARTTKFQKTHEYSPGVLSESEENFLRSSSITSEMSPLEMAKLCFRDPNIALQSREHRLTIEFMKKERPEILDPDNAGSSKYLIPRSYNRMVPKINSAATLEFDHSNLSDKVKRFADWTMKCVQAPRFIETLEAYESVRDRDYFEKEFIRSVWDKPDLSTEEINLYITLCANYIREKDTTKELDKLKKLFSLAETADELSVKFSQMIQAKNTELNDLQKRNKDLTKDLNGSRYDRMKGRNDRNSSFNTVVEAFKNKDERDNMIRMAQMKNKLTAKGLEEIESMAEWKARVVGIDKDDIL